MLGSIVLFTAAATGFYVPAPIRGSPPRIASPIRALEKPAGLPQVRNGLFISQVGTVAAWSACAQFAMCTYKPHRLVHNYIGTTQALTAIPLIWACFSVLISATKQGVVEWPQYRKLSLGLAAASIWSAIAVVWSPVFTAAIVRTSDPVLYPPALKAAAAATHLFSAAICTWAATLGATAKCLTCGAIGSLWHLGPKGASDRGSAYESVRATASLAFLTFTAFAVFAPLPLATVPSLLGKRLARAFGAWTLLAAVALQVLKDEPEGTSVTREIHRGLRFMSILHLLLLVVRRFAESAAVYPAAMACLPAMVASTVVYLVLAVAGTS